MSKLAEILRESGPPANAANPANKGHEISNISGISSPLFPDSEMQAAGYPLVVCEDCLHLRDRSGERPDGHCRRFATETWKSVAFPCGGFEHKGTSERVRNDRRRAVLANLDANPARNRAFIAAQQEDGSCLVTIAVRGKGDGDVVIPAGRFSDPKDWATLLRDMEKQP